MSQIQTHKLVARLEACHEHSHVGLCARVGRHIGILGTENLFQALNGQILALVNALAATIITVTRITLGLLVGKAASHGLHNLVADEILTGNEFDTMLLAQMLALDDVKNRFVSFHFQFLSLSC